MGYRLNSSGHFLPFLFLTWGAFSSSASRDSPSPRLSSVLCSRRGSPSERFRQLVPISVTMLTTQSDPPCPPPRNPQGPGLSGAIWSAHCQLQACSCIWQLTTRTLTRRKWLKVRAALAGEVGPQWWWRCINWYNSLGGQVWGHVRRLYESAWPLTLLTHVVIYTKRIFGLIYKDISTRTLIVTLFIIAAKG